MAIDPAEVLRIAKLARLEIEPAETRQLARDLERIVDFIDGLSDVALPPDAESFTYFDTDVHREDRSGECLERDDALANAPETDGVYFLVPKIVDKDA